MICPLDVTRTNTVTDTVTSRGNVTPVTRLTGDRVKSEEEPLTKNPSFLPTNLGRKEGLENRKGQTR